MILSLKIPLGATLLVKSGQKLDLGIPIYESKAEIDFPLRIADKLDVAPDKIFRYLKKFVGEKIEKGTTIAVKKSLFTTKKVISDRSGVIKEVNHHDGIVVISSPDEQQHVHLSALRGEVAEVAKNELKIKLADATDYPLKKSEDSFGGTIWYLKSDQESILTSGSVRNKIIIGQTINEFTQTKIGALGAAGIVSLLKPEHTTVPFALVQNIDDLKKVTEKSFTYCFVDHPHSRIVFYD